MTLTEIASFMRDAVKGYVAKAVAQVSAELASLRPAMEALANQSKSFAERDVILQKNFAALDERTKVTEAIAKALPDAVDKAIEALMPELIAKAAAAVAPPKDGKDADPEVVRAMVLQAVAEMPKPKDGLDADPAAIIRAAKDAVDALPKPANGTSVTVEDVEPLIMRLVDEAVLSLPPPKDGTCVEIEDVKPVLARLVGEAVAALPPARDGKSVDPEMIAAEIAVEVKTQMAAIPPAAPGKDADPEFIRSEIARMVAELPKPKDGKDGDDGIGEPGRDALDVQVLPAIDEAKVYQRGTFACHRGGLIMAARKTSPITGTLEDAGWKVCMNGIAGESDEWQDGEVRRATFYTDGSKIAREVHVDDLIEKVESIVGCWQTDFEQRAVATLERAVEQLPKPKDGAPGADIEDFDIAINGRMFGIAMQIGGKPVLREIKLDMAIDRGVFQSGKKYEKGDIVTYSGSAFIAQCDTTDKPEESKSWRMFVKRGRDGKDAGIES